MFAEMFWKEANAPQIMLQNSINLAFMCCDVMYSALCENPPVESNYPKCAQQLHCIQ